MSMSVMVSKLKAVVKDPTLFGTFIITVGIFLGSIFSYLLQIGLGYLLSIEDFGVFNAFLSLSILFSIPAAAVSVSLIKKVSQYLARNDFVTLRRFFWSLTKTSLVLGLVLALMFILLNKQIADYLNIPHDEVVLVFAGFLALSFLTVAPLAYLQGLLRFKAYAFLSVISQFLRLVIPLILVYAGFAVAGAYAGLMIVGLISFGLSVLLLKKNLKSGGSLQAGQSESMMGIYKTLLLFSVPVFFINSGLSMLNNVDIIMVKHFFSPYEAGIYSGVITMCKVFLFGATIVQAVMFPQISHLYALGANYKNRFFKFLTIQMLAIFIGLGVFALFPSLINQVMFGGKFAASVPYMPLFSVFIAFYILIIFLSMFLLAVNKTRAYLIILPACAAQYLLILIWHANLYNVIKVNILSAGIACLFVVMYVVQSMREGVDHNPHL